MRMWQKLSENNSKEECYKVKKKRNSTYINTFNRDFFLIKKKRLSSYAII